MNFADLYRFSNGLESKNTPFRVLRDQVKVYHPRVGDVETWECDLDTTISFGHLKYVQERSSPYEDSYDVAIIRFDRSLNRCWRRYVSTKELMHVFDDSTARANDAERFMVLLRELETRPLPEHMSSMLQSELVAEWMAVLVLCPQRLRDNFRSLYRVDGSADLEIADQLKIPKVLIRSIMSDYYDRALERLTGDVTGNAFKKTAKPSSIKPKRVKRTRI